MNKKLIIVGILMIVFISGCTTEGSLNQFCKDKGYDGGNIRIIEKSYCFNENDSVVYEMKCIHTVGFDRFLFIECD